MTPNGPTSPNGGDSASQPLGPAGVPELSDAVVEPPVNTFPPRPGQPGTRENPVPLGEVPSQAGLPAAASMVDGLPVEGAPQAPPAGAPGSWENPVIVEGPSHARTSNSSSEGVSETAGGAGSPGTGTDDAKESPALEPIHPAPDTSKEAPDGTAGTLVVDQTGPGGHVEAPHEVATAWPPLEEGLQPGLTASAEKSPRSPVTSTSSTSTTLPLTSTTTSPEITTTHPPGTTTTTRPPEMTTTTRPPEVRVTPTTTPSIMNTVSTWRGHEDRTIMPSTTAPPQPSSLIDRPTTIPEAITTTTRPSEDITTTRPPEAPNTTTRPTTTTTIPVAGTTIVPPPEHGTFGPDAPITGL